jgi:hypothetical protein
MRGPLRKMISFFLVESRLGARHGRIDWTLVLFWGGIAIALLMLLAAR